MTSIRVGCCLAALLASPVLTAEAALLESGTYEIEVKLKLPRLKNMTGKKIVRVCLASEPNENNHGIAVHSDNNPLTWCLVSNVPMDGSELTFDIACESKTRRTLTRTTSWHRPPSVVASPRR